MSLTERSPLLRDEEKVNDEIATTKAEKGCRVVHILGELIGARHLDITEKKIEPYFVVQFGSKFLHRTTPLMKSTKSSILTSDPIWSIKESPLFIVSILPIDIITNKRLVITLWTRQPKSRLKMSLSKRQIKIEFGGEIHLNASDILSSCQEERIELLLLDELGRKVKGASDQDPLLAVRFRVASSADIQFVHAWNKATEMQNTRIPRTVLDGTGVLVQEHRNLVDLLTEIDEREVSGAKLRTTLSSNVSVTVPRSSPRGMIRIKPGPDPDHPITGAYMEREELKEKTKHPSKQWIEAGSGTLGKIFLEILSCHGLPNVDIGNAVGNQTDAFVSVIYGDTMVQTCIIDDEISPHWLPWTQRAFVLNMLHPSQVLYLAVFGYKRGLLHHYPIGRVEINPMNLQRDTEYMLKYALFHSSHITDRKSSGSIRIRLRIALSNEQSALFAVLKPPPEIYVNVRQRKSFHVARYTCCGEYDSEEKFNLKVLLSYIDEIKDSYLRRLIYGISDGGQSLIFWRGQVKVGNLLLPVHSFLLFCSGVILVEQPQFIPSFFFLGMAWFMLANANLRQMSPSPWYRCLSFQHYLEILIRGKSTLDFEPIHPGEGWSGQQDIMQALKKRKEDDARFFEKKEAVEKELEEVQSVSLHTKSNIPVIPVELLVILGKVQGIVGNICRCCRLIDAIVTWEESAVSFWITLIFLSVGLFFAMIPWSFLIKWTARLSVVLLLGPQNKLLDMFVVRQTTDEHKIFQLFAARLFKARCRQEEAVKLKAFLHIIYGKFSTVVPTLSWTPHQDRPLHDSQAHVIGDQESKLLRDLLYIPGQKLYGKMIPRPYEQWVVNRDESSRVRARAESTLLNIDEKTTMTLESSPLIETGSNVLRQSESTESGEGEKGLVEKKLKPPKSEKGKVAKIIEHGLQLNWGEKFSDTYHNKARFFKKIFFQNQVASTKQPGINKLNAMERRESLHGDWGEEVVDVYDEEAQFTKQSFRVHAKEGNHSETLTSPAETEKEFESRQGHDNLSLSSSASSLKQGAKDRNESIEGDLGVEVTEMFDEEARFVQQSWRGSIHHFDYTDLSDSDEESERDRKALINPDSSIISEGSISRTTKLEDASEISSIENIKLTMINDENYGEMISDGTSLIANVEPDVKTLPSDEYLSMSGNNALIQDHRDAVVKDSEINSKEQNKSGPQFIFQHQDALISEKAHSEMESMDCIASPLAKNAAIPDHQTDPVWLMRSGDSNGESHQVDTVASFGQNLMNRKIGGITLNDRATKAMKKTFDIAERAKDAAKTLMPHQRKDIATHNSNLEESFEEQGVEVSDLCDDEIAFLSQNF
jgi:C2 domain